MNPNAGIPSPLRPWTRRSADRGKTPFPGLSLPSKLSVDSDTAAELGRKVLLEEVKDVVD